MARVSLSIVAVLALLAPSLASELVTELHGSGTTNPSKCYWHVMDQINARSKQSVKMTYRGIGSGSGQTEFMAEGNPVVDFASGDVAFSKDDYDELQTRGVEVLQLPVFLGAVSFFHNVFSNRQDLNMTGCVLAKIFKGDITTWDDQEIKDLNPDHAISAGLKITVIRRDDSSSSTNAITSYLNTACPAEWPISLVGKTITWPGPTEACSGSGGVTDCINDVRGTIGYLDAGHGHLQKLGEVALENLGGTTLTTKTAIENGGIASAAEAGQFPSDATGDFSEVSLMNQPGKYTWPIVSTTYLYVRKNLDFITEPGRQSLLIAFLQALYDDSFIGECEEVYKLNKVTGDTLALALAGIESIIWTGDALNFESKSKTEIIIGAGDDFISGKRQSAVDLAIGQKRLEVEQLMQDMDRVSFELAAALKQTSLIKANIAAMYKVRFFEIETREVYDATGNRVAIALSVIGIFFWFVAVIGLSLSPKPMEEVEDLDDADDSPVVVESLEEAQPAAYA